MTWPLGAISRDATGAHILAPTLGHDPGPQLTCIITSTLGLQYIGDFDTIALKDLAISHVSKNRGVEEAYQGIKQTTDFLMGYPAITKDLNGFIM